MKRRAGLGVFGTLLAVLAAPIHAGDDELIALKDGRQIVGEVVSEKPNALWVDVGFDLIRIPRDAIVDRRKPDEPPKVAISNDFAPRDVDPSGFFRAATLKSRPIKDLVSEYGEG